MYFCVFFCVSGRRPRAHIAVPVEMTKSAMSAPQPHVESTEIRHLTVLLCGQLIHVHVIVHDWLVPFSYPSGSDDLLLHGQMLHVLL